MDIKDSMTCGLIVLLNNFGCISPLIRNSYLGLGQAIVWLHMGINCLYSVVFMTSHGNWMTYFNSIFKRWNGLVLMRIVLEGRNHCFLLHQLRNQINHPNRILGNLQDHPAYEKHKREFLVPESKIILKTQSSRRQETYH